jgi:hypothetical protein
MFCFSKVLTVMGKPEKKLRAKGQGARTAFFAQEFSKNVPRG